MAPTWLDKNVHPNTQEETEKILNKLRTRKINCRTGDELTKFFAKLNAENVNKTSKNVGNSPATLGDHQVTYGPISSIPPGTWWGIRMDLSRDRVHTPLDSPIDSSSLGAISLCTPHSNPQNDVDQGDYLTFTAPSSSPTPSTHPLVLSSQNNLPIRLIRGYNLRNPFSPKTGYRYDGLYLIVTFWLIESPPSSPNLRFALVRIDQGPPPWIPPAPGHHSPLKNTRNASKITGKCQLDCCKPSKPPRSSISDLNNSSITPLTKQLDKKQESSIVMRRVSKKCESLNGGESPKLNNPPKSTFKLQNTNISIRTDLYDSSPNPQDVKKTPMTFCRVYNSSKGQVKPVQSTSAGILNLNTFGPGAKDKIQQSQIQMRSGGKTASPVMELFSRMDDGTVGDSDSPSEGSNGLVHDFMRIDLKDGDKIFGIMKKRSHRASEGSDESDGSLESPLEIDLNDEEKDKTPGESVIKGIIDNSEVITDKKSEKYGKIIANESIPQTTTPKSSKLDKKASTKTLYSLRSSSPKKETDEGKNLIKKSVIKQQKGTDNSSRENISKNLKKGTKSKVESFTNSSKKRQSELAKLEIDGNFVTKTRGPRTRRFPYAMRGFSKRRDNLRYLKGRTKPDISKKTKLIKRNNTSDVKSSRILQNRPLTTKSSSNQNIEPKKSIIPDDKSVDAKKLDKSTQKSGIKKSKMVDKCVQCTLQKDASTSVDPEDINRSINYRRVRNWVKSEDEDSDDDLEEIIYKDSSVQTQKGEILRPNFVKRSLQTAGRFGGGNSAFVPVNMSDVDFRIARLRSIGFKPIDPCDYEPSSAFSEYRQGSKAPVVRRDVGEQYEKYTSEENNVVGYMDDDLRYQDIEAERGAKRGLRKRKKSEEGEEPWLGWKKFTHL